MPVTEHQTGIRRRDGVETPILKPVYSCDVCGEANAGHIYIKPGEPTRVFCFAHNPERKATKEKVA